MDTPKTHSGLSPSSFSLFQACPRKYYHYKVAKTPIDSDVSENTESLDVGKCFHKILENTRHNLNGLTYAIVVRETIDHSLNPDIHAPLIFAMLSQYKKVHEKSGLKVLACEHEIETPRFYGIVDVVLSEGKKFWIGDMKTAASFYQSLIPTLPRHPQLNLYAAHIEEIADALDLSPKNFAGCRYLLTTKSKLIQKAKETTAEYIGRLSKSVKSFDFIIPREMLDPAKVVTAHSLAADYVYNHTRDLDYQPNYGNCMAYNRPCNYYSQCHGKQVTSLYNSLDFISSED